MIDPGAGEGGISVSPPLIRVLTTVPTVGVGPYSLWMTSREPVHARRDQQDRLLARKGTFHLMMT